MPTSIPVLLERPPHLAARATATSPGRSPRRRAAAPRAGRSGSSTAPCSRCSTPIWCRSKTASRYGARSRHRGAPRRRTGGRPDALHRGDAVGSRRPRPPPRGATRAVRPRRPRHRPLGRLARRVGRRRPAPGGSAVRPAPGSRSYRSLNAGDRPRRTGEGRRRDGVFVVHELAATPAQNGHAGLLRAALAVGGGDRLPEIAGPRLVELYGGRAEGVGELIGSLRPESVLLAGPETWWLPGGSTSVAGTVRGWCRCPSSGDDPVGDLAPFDPLVTGVDAVGVLSRAESRRVAERSDGGDGSAQGGGPRGRRARGRLRRSTAPPPTSSWSGCPISAASSSC